MTGQKLGYLADENTTAGERCNEVNHLGPTGQVVRFPSGQSGRQTGQTPPVLTGGCPVSGVTNIGLHRVERALKRRGLVLERQNRRGVIRIVETGIGEEFSPRHWRQS
jgi:hypothetical protein